MIAAKNITAGRMAAAATTAAMRPSGLKTSGMRTLAGLFLFCLCLWGMAAPASAEIYKCTINGKLVFQDRGCNEGVEEQLGETADTIHDLDPSWFDMPARLQRNPVCNTEECHCGGKVFPLEKDTEWQLINALTDLQSKWANHDVEFRRYSGLRRPTMQDLAYVEASACEVAVRQQIIRNLYNTVAADIIQASAAPHPDEETNAHRCQTASASAWSQRESGRTTTACVSSSAGMVRSAPIYDMLLDSLETVRQPRPRY